MYREVRSESGKGACRSSLSRLEQLRAELRAPLAPGSGYWCSAGSHEAGEVVSWSGRIPAARSIKGVEVAWVHGAAKV